MKGRGQKPDAFTYTIILRGLTWNHTKTPSAVERAVSVFHSMLAPNSPVRPSTIHANAVVEVCAKARNLDALYGVIARLPTHGQGAPDRMTYTMTLNCLKEVALDSAGAAGGFEKVDRPTLVGELIIQGKRIWADVVSRWRSGTIEMDEQLACSMGRLLFLGDARNKDEILSLMQQAARLERAVPAMGDLKRPENLPEVSDTVEDRIDPDVTENSVQPGMNTEVDHKASDNLFSADIQDRAVRIWAVPGPQTLSLLLDACREMNAIKAAQSYWGTLTSMFEPDLENFHCYLRLLRVSRASSLAVELLRQMAKPKDQDGFGLKLQGKSFLLAMSACKRDVNNAKCLHNVAKILHMMPKHLDVPDVRTANMATVLLGWKNGKWHVDDVLEVLQALEANYKTLKAQHAYGGGELSTRRHKGPDMPRGEWREEMREFLYGYSELIRRVLGKYREQLAPETAQMFERWQETHTKTAKRWAAVGKEIDGRRTAGAQDGSGTSEHAAMENVA